MNRSLFIICLISICLGPSTSVLADPWRNEIGSFLEQNCLDCHSGAAAEGDFDLAALGSDLADQEITRRWIAVHDRLERGEMPPPEMPRPEQAAKTSALNTLAAALDQAEQARAQVVLRRLNRAEYENTVRDLFDVHVEVKQMLPEDTPAAGFDNVGEGLAVSAEAMQAYLRAANTTVDAVLGPPGRPKQIDMTTNLLDQKGHDGKPFGAKHIGNMFRKTDKGLVIFQSGYCPTTLVNFSRERPPAGTYRVRMNVRAIQSEEPVTLRVYGGDTLVNRRERHLVGYFDVPPDQWSTIEFEDRLVEAGGTYQPKCYGTRDTRKNADTYPEPGIEIGDIHLQGPLEPWPPLSREKLLGDLNLEQATLADARVILADLLPRAFRRPTSPDEVEPYVDLVAAALEQERSFEDALRVGMVAILCSPEFLFLEEPTSGQIEGHALAARLSYFLWSSLPDEQLTRLAASGKLSDPEVLRAQTERMLADPRAKAFTRNFTGQWLDLREIDFTEPDMNLYPEFDELLKISMPRETELFFQEVLDQNLSLLNFVDSDFTFLNERLAQHYGIENVRGQAFRKVQLPAQSVRGGVLTQASVLKVTANGTNTSPVIRGHWVLEHILGRPTPPPPDNVGSVEPDIRGATTIREQLAKHRAIESCAMCHKHIDPPGFALESFDVIGGWRERYRSVGEGERPDFKQAPFTFAWVRYRIGLPVDATGQLADGTKFEDIREFKTLLVSQSDQLARSLTEKVATYAIGRSMRFSDREEIESIVNRLEKNNYRFRSLVHEVVQSDMFQRP